MPKVSVCCSVLNQSAWLDEMIGSVVAQKFQDWELIIIDDGSTEDIPAVVNKWNDPRIQLIRWDENRGVPHGINEAMRRASGEYLQPLAADELIHPEKLRVQVNYLDGHPDVAAVFGLPRNGEQGLRPAWEQYQLKAHNRSRMQWLQTLLNVDQVPLGGCSALWRRSVHDEIGYFDDTLKAFSDHEWYVRLVERFKIHIQQFRWTAFRTSPDQVSGAANTPEKIENLGRELGIVRKKHPVAPEQTNGMVTVGIPTKDMSWCVLEAISSVYSQTYKNFEIWVVDDGSTDDTEGLITHYILENGLTNIHFHRFEENKGDRVAYAHMLERAKGDFFVPLSADDTIEPTFLERALMEFEKDACCELVGCQTDFIQKNGAPFTEDHPWKQIERASNKSQQDWINRFYYGNVYFGATMFKTQALKDVGGWKQQYGCISDYAMYLELIHRANFRIIEETLSHTRIHESNISKGFDQNWLRQTYFDIKKKFYAPRTRLIIATPFYESRGFSPYILALSQTIKLLCIHGVDHEFWEVSGDAYVDRAKNTIVNKFLENPENTHLLMIDSDMWWSPDAVIKILSMPEELIVASYPMKNAWERWTSMPFIGKNEDGTTYTQGKLLPDGSALIECAQLAGGFMMFKRAILDRYKEQYKDLNYKDHSADPLNPERVYTEFFCCERADGLRWGEDRVFSKRLNAMGEKSWIYPNITIAHYGINQWMGNFDEYLRKAKADADKVNVTAQ